MNKIFLIIIISVIAINLYAQKPIKKVKIENEIDSFSYALGVSIASNLRKQDILDVNAIAIGKAIQDCYGLVNTMSESEANEFIQNYFENKDAGIYQETIDAGKKFLEENSKKTGVVTLKSGLQYKVIKEGTGKSPSIKDEVKTHYEGKLLDGTVFDSSYKRDEPLTFPLDGVIRGWTEALQLMKEGAVWELYIPYDLAYGSRDMGTIKPYSTLIFKVELISVEEQ